MLKYVITGTGRCGTGWISKVLTQLGSACGHEAVFTPDGVIEQPKLEGDSSWLAVGWPFSVDVFHIIRHPMDTISSIAGIETLMGPRLNKWGRFMRLRLPEIDLLSSPVEKASYFVTEWISRIDCIDVIRLEDPDLLIIGGITGCNLEDVKRVVDDTPVYNSRSVIKLKDFPPEVYDLVETLGYSVDDYFRRIE